jgi:predicted ATPase
MPTSASPHQAAYLRAIRLERAKVPSFEAYPFNLPAIFHLREVALHPAVTFFVGENGSGKSSLLEAVATAWGFNPEGGSRNFNFETRRSHSCLSEYLTLVRGTIRPKDGYFLRAESFFNVASEIERLDAGPGGVKVASSYGDKPLHEQSHGESFLALAMHRFRSEGFYILDEPEAALSPTRQMSLLIRIKELAAMGAQFLIATHSPLLLAYPEALIWGLSKEGIQRMEYRDTDQFVVMKRFLDDPEGMMARLFATEDPS